MEIEEQEEEVITQIINEERLIITQIEMVNFKSYAGKKVDNFSIL